MKRRKQSSATSSPIPIPVVKDPSSSSPLSSSSSTSVSPTAKRFKVLEHQPPVPNSSKTNGIIEPIDRKAGVGDGGQWEKVEKRKKVKKNATNSEAGPPRFYYHTTELKRRQEPVGIADIRDFILHLLGVASPQPWVKVDNRDAIPKVVALFVPGIVPEHINLPQQPTSPLSNPNVPLEIPIVDKSSTASFNAASFFRGAPNSPSAFANGFDPHSMFKSAFPPSPFATATETAAPVNAIGASFAPSAPNDSSLRNCIPFIPRKFSHTCPTRAPGEPTRMHSVLSAFFSVPMTLEEKRKKVAKEEKEAKAKSSKGVTDIYDPSRFTLTLPQMRQNEYPLPSCMDKDVEEQEDGWVEVSLKEIDGRRSKVYAVDCEMCLTEGGKELARICVIDYDNERVVMDKLVKPAHPITDYLTRWSGITEAALDGITTTLSSVQSELLRLLNRPSEPTPIIIGHSLENDLRAIKLAYPRCIDTALLFHHPRGRPLKPGLAWLVKKWCDGREVQNRGEGGHDPEEDARACVELVKRKCRNGPGFGEFRTDVEGLFERLARGTKRSGIGGRWIISSGGEDGVVSELKTAVVDRGKNPAAWHGAGASTTIGCSSDEDVLKGVLTVLPEHDFVWARFMAVAEASGWIQSKQDKESTDEGTTIASGNSDTTNPTKIKTALKQLNSHLNLVYASLPPRTAFIIFTGHSDPREMGKLQTRKNEFESALRGGVVGEGSSARWSAADGRALEEAVELARRGLLFLCIKGNDD